MRNCKTCQHLKRPEIDRRLAAGEASTAVARDHDLTVSSVHRHRTNCLKLASSNQIKKEAARGSAAVTLLPSRETLSGAYLESAGDNQAIRIICVLRSHGPSVLRSAMNSPCRCAAGAIGSCIKLAMRLCGGKLTKSMRWKPPSSFGNKPIHRPSVPEK
jgi:hypothetical protein